MVSRLLGYNERFWSSSSFIWGFHYSGECFDDDGFILDAFNHQRLADNTVAIKKLFLLRKFNFNCLSKIDALVLVTVTFWS